MAFATPGYIPDYIEPSEEKVSLFLLESQAKLTLHLINYGCHKAHR